MLTMEFDAHWSWLLNEVDCLSLEAFRWKPFRLKEMSRLWTSERPIVPSDAEQFGFHCDEVRQIITYDS